MNGNGDFRTAEQQAMEDALLSSDAGRAMEILRRTLAHGTKVPDPDVVEAIASQPASPPPIVRRHRWVRTAVPLCVGALAIVASLGWSYADFNARQQEWQRIAEEQTNVAAQQEKAAQEWERIAREQDAFVRKVEAFETAKRERRARQAQRVQEAIILQEWDRAFVDLATLGDFIACDEPNQAAVDQFCHLVDDLITRAKDQGPPSLPPNSPVPKEQ